MIQNKAVPCRCRERDSLQIVLHDPVDRHHKTQDLQEHGRNLVGIQPAVANAL